MKIAYFDCFSGISGNMVLGALIDAGLDKNFLIKELKKIPVSSYKIFISKVRRAGFPATLVEIKITGRQPVRNLKEIKKIILKSRLAPAAQKKIIQIFANLARAESLVHGIPLPKVHFHEIGAVDAILDIAGAVIGLEKLGVEKIFASALNLGSGTVKTTHGRLPVPAPATLELTKGTPVFQNFNAEELTTPTGAAIIKTLGAGFGPLPAMTPQKTGAGAGTKNFPNLPNILRIIVGEAATSSKEQEIMVEFNLDDASPQIFENFFEKAFQNGALDVYLTPVQMKKNRPAVKVSLLVPQGALKKIIDLIFSETPSFGLRWWPIEKVALERKFLFIKTPLGKIKFKAGFLNGKIVNLAPEYEDLKKIAAGGKIPFKKAWQLAQIASSKYLC